MKIFGFIILMGFSAACFSAPVDPAYSDVTVSAVSSLGMPDYSGLANVPESGRKAYFDAMKVNQVKCDKLRIDQDWYGLPTYKKICRGLDYNDARHAANGAFGREIALDIAPPATLGLSVFLGVYCGTIAYVDSENLTTVSNGTTTVTTQMNPGEKAYIYQGAVAGACVGVVAAAIEYYVLHRSVTKQLTKSGQLFNEDLGRDLNLNMNPQAGGASVGVNKSF